MSATSLQMIWRYDESFFIIWQSPVRHDADDPMLCENSISNPVPETAGRRTVFPDIAVMWFYSRLITTQVLPAAFRNF